MRHVREDLLAPNKVSQERRVFPSGCPTLNSGHHLAIRLGDEGNMERWKSGQRMMVDVVIITVIAASIY